MTSTSAHHVAASLTQEALAAVYEPTAVALLREDSPLSALGMTEADVVCIADALAVGAARRGLTCVLDDVDLVDLVDLVDVGTVATLIGAVQAKIDTPLAAL